MRNLRTRRKMVTMQKDATNKMKNPYLHKQAYRGVAFLMSGFAKNNFSALPSAFDNGLPLDEPSTNRQLYAAKTTMSSQETNGKGLEAAIRAADRFHGRGTSFIHTKDTLGINSHDTNSGTSNPTGAVVEPISLATTFVQRSPGVTTGREDHNSFGLGYEYSRTGNPTRG